MNGLKKIPSNTWYTFLETIKISQLFVLAPQPHWKPIRDTLAVWGGAGPDCWVNSSPWAGLGLLGCGSVGHSLRAGALPAQARACPGRLLGAPGQRGGPAAEGGSPTLHLGGSPQECPAECRHSSSAVQTAWGTETECPLRGHEHSNVPPHAGCKVSQYQAVDHFYNIKYISLKHFYLTTESLCWLVNNFHFIKSNLDQKFNPPDKPLAKLINNVDSMLPKLRTAIWF